MCIGHKKFFFFERIFLGPGGFEQPYGQPFDNFGPPMMGGRPPFGRPPRGFGGPMIRGTK